MSSSRSFPPGAGWIPLTVAVAVIAVASGIAFSPRYENTTVGVVQPQASGAPRVGPQASASANQGDGQTADPNRPQQKQDKSGVLAPSSGIDCKHGQNGGPTAPGVTKDTITVATTDVTSGVGADFLKEATVGMQVAIDQLNASGGICGRHINLKAPVNSGWSRTQGRNDIDGFIQEGDVFALVAEPDSEGLAGAIDSGIIDNANMPVVGTDGMLSDQYQDRWVWPVATSTVANMHIAVKYAIDRGWAKNSSDFAIIYDTRYKFGAEGAAAFDHEVKNLSADHGDVPGYPSAGCSNQYCGVSSDAQDYTSEKNAFNGVCESKCKVVVLLLEPSPAEKWWTDEGDDTGWFQHLVGGEPLFEKKFAESCKGHCNQMTVWTGYHPVLQPFDAEAAVNTYKNGLLSACPNCDTQNQFTEGAYLGTQLFIAACRQLADSNVRLTRQTLHDVLNSTAYSLGLSMPLQYHDVLPRVANVAMAAYADNSGQTFNSWIYTNSGFVNDPQPGVDIEARSS
jgi:ABC-type branched-subunit amino acid transport system substrate-binding protein